MRKILILSVFLASCGGSSPIPPAEGQQFNDVLTITQPTTRVDGSALPLSAIAQYNAEWGHMPNGPFTVGSAVVPKGTTATFTWPNNNRPKGRMCYRLQTLDTAGLLSDWTDSACSEFKCGIQEQGDPATGLCVAIARPNSPVVTVQ